MLIASFGACTGWAGKTIAREGDAFILQDHGPITAADIMSYDAQGQLVWADEGTRAWVGSLVQRPTDAPQAQHPDASRPRAGSATPWATSSVPQSRTTSQRLLLPVVGIVAVVLVLLILAVAGVFSGEKKATDTQLDAQASPSTPTTPAASWPVRLTGNWVSPTGNTPYEAISIAENGGQSASITMSDTDDTPHIWTVTSEVLSNRFAGMVWEFQRVGIGTQPYTGTYSHTVAANETYLGQGPPGTVTYFNVAFSNDTVTIAETHAPQTPWTQTFTISPDGQMLVWGDGHFEGTYVRQ